MEEQSSPSIEPNPTFPQKTVSASTIIQHRLPGERSDALASKQLAQLPSLPVRHRRGSRRPSKFPTVVTVGFEDDDQDYMSEVSTLILQAH